MARPQTSSQGLSAAESLVGLPLKDGWRVVTRIERGDEATGGHFSVGYEVVHEDGRRGYLKALDYSIAFGEPDVARALQFLTASYNFEKDVLTHCRAKRVKRVVLAIAGGSIVVPGVFHYPHVDYLIFELADGDIRNHLADCDQIDPLWLLCSLHHVASGLHQLHVNNIAHQDVKPSNVLVGSSGDSMVADLGRASSKAHQAPHDGFSVAGDNTYAPPELLYGAIPAEWPDRRVACDAYLLGSLIMFYFTRTTMTAALMSRIHESQHWTTWGGTFEQIRPFLVRAFGNVMAGVRAQLSAACPSLAEQLTTMISRLCHPDPAQRGHPVDRLGGGNPFSLRRFVSELDCLARKMQSRLL